MRPRLIMLLLAIVLLPLALLAGVGTYLAREQRAMQQHRLREFVAGTLAERDAEMRGVFEALGRQFGELARTTPPQADALRQIARESPAISQAFVLDAQGELLFPREDAEPTASERALLQRLQPVWRRGELRQALALPTDLRYEQQPSASAPAAPASTAQTGQSAESQMDATAQKQYSSGRIDENPREGATLPPPSQSGWYSWYWDNGSHFIFWQRIGDGRVLCFELERARLAAMLIEALPETTVPGGRYEEAAQSASLRGRTQLRDANGEVVYQWGPYDPPQGATPLVSYGLSAPLQAWRLDQFTPPQLLAAGLFDRGFLLLAGLLGSGALLVLLATYFYRVSTREMREAAQRVNFVNQVSHELKTPLTNIRLYAELMEQRLDDEADPQLRQNLEIITGESQRLSRLIANVLSFARSTRHTLTLRPQTQALDSIVAETAEKFRPALARRAIAIETTLQAPRPVALDPEAIEQILGNLLSNVEKYGFRAEAASTVRLTTAQTSEGLSLDLRDEGPGIPAGERERIFLPFERLSNRLTDGVAGTGIGLTIARELARLHGGDLELIDAPRSTQPGAVFRLTLRPLAPRTESTA